MNTPPQQPPSCHEVREWLLDYLTPVPGDDWLTPEQRRAVDIHVEGCPACRKEMADMDRVVSTIRELGKIKIPEDSINRMVDFAKKLEAQSRAAAEDRRKEQTAAEKPPVAHEGICVLKSQGIPQAARPYPRLIALWAGGGLVAAVIFLFVFISAPEKTATISEVPLDVSLSLEQPAESPSVDFKNPFITLSESFLALDALLADKPLEEDVAGAEPRPSINALAKAGSAMAFLTIMDDIFGHHSSLKELFASFTPEQWSALAEIVTEAIHRWPEDRLTGALHRRHSTALFGMGMAERARDALLAGADCDAAFTRRQLATAGIDNEEKVHQAVCAAVLEGLRPEMEKLIEAKDHLSILSLSDALISRYPATELAFLGQYAAGRTYFDSRRFTEAAQIWSQLADDDPQGDFSRKVVALYAASLANTGNCRKATNVWLAEAQRSSEDRHHQANSLYNAAGFTLLPGGNMVQGLRLYRQVVDEYSDTAYADVARRKLEQIRRKNLAGDAILGI